MKFLQLASPPFCRFEKHFALVQDGEMKTITMLLLSLFLVTSCKESAEELNPLNSLGQGASDDSSQVSSIESEYMQLLNDHRSSLGLRPLILHEQMSSVALNHSSNMARGLVAFGHTGFSVRCSQVKSMLGGGNLCGEIVAMGQTSAQKVFNSWMNSSGHRAKMEEGRYTHTGFAYAKSGSGTIYWTQIFLEVD